MYRHCMTVINSLFTLADTAYKVIRGRSVTHSKLMTAINSLFTETATFWPFLIYLSTCHKIQKIQRIKWPIFATFFLPLSHPSPSDRQTDGQTDVKKMDSCDDGLPNRAL